MRKGCSLLLSAVMLLALNRATWAAESTGQPSGQVSFTGKVLDSQGQPIPDAKVTLYAVNYGNSDSLPTAERINEVVTGPDGAFSFTATKESRGYRQGSIIVLKGGFALGWAVWDMQEGDQQSDIPLGEPRELSGAVVDEGDSPVIDAEVSIAIAIIGREEDRRYLTYFVAPELLTVKTDSTGRFVFANMPQEATCEFLAKKPGRATTCTFDPSTYRGERCQFSPGQTGIKLTLPIEARIEGQVVDSVGQPVGGVQVVAQPDRAGLPFTVEPVPSAQDGTFFVGNLAAGVYTVQLPQRRESADWVAQSVKLNLKAGETVRDVRFLLSKGALVEVLVKEDPSGNPVEKADVGIRNVATQQWHRGQTDANGVARLRLAAGDYELSSVYKQGYSRPRQLSETFTVDEGQTRTLEHMLAGLPSITGVVYDDAGKPLEGVKVQVMPSGHSGVGTSDAEGKFKAGWDPEGWSSDRTVFYLMARHPGRDLAVAQPMDSEEGPVELRLRPAATLTGRVVDPNGKPIGGAYPHIMLHASSWGSSFLPSRSITTDAEGRFEMETLPPEQRYDITATADGHGQTRIDLNESQVTSGRVEAGTLVLPLANLSVSGVVVDSEGKPVSGASVSCYGSSRDNQPNRDTRTDAEGQFTLDRVCPGRISISANAQSGGVNLNGYIQTEGGASNVQIVISERSNAMRYVPRKPASLKGKRLPDPKKLGIELPADANDRMLLVCFWDMNQRPSRHCMSELIRQAAQLADKGVTLVGVHGGPVDQTALEQWIEQSKPSFPVICLADKVEETKFEWGAASLPHLILTDKDHIVIAEGFALLGELDKRIEEASGR